jgi:putative membrane protein
MPKLARLGFVVGVLLLAVIGGKLGPSHLLSALSVSPAPVAVASAYHVVPLVFYAQSWRCLLPRTPRPSFLSLLRLRWMGESINLILPVAQVGGDVARARRLVATGVSAPDAGASMIADLSIGAFTQILFTVAGLVALSTQARVGGLARPIAGALAFVVAIGAGCAAVIRLGVHRIASRLPMWRTLTGQWKGLAGGAARLDASLRALWSQRGRLAVSFALHLVGWFSQVVETWLVLAVLGTPIRWAQALVIESLTATARGAAFFVPGGLGVQEASVVGLGRYLGLPVEVAVVIGVVKRCRELVVGLPAVIWWAYTEKWRRREPQGDGSRLPAPEASPEGNGTDGEVPQS